MVDTVKLQIPIRDPSTLNKGAFAPMSVEQLVNTYSNSRTYLNPSPTYAKRGLYMPRLTLHRRPSKVGIFYQLEIEFSAPKILFGNNFDELTEEDFDVLLDLLQAKLWDLTGHRFFKQQLRTAAVGAWHPSKNIVFLNYTGCQTVLNAIWKADVSRTYDLQYTDFQDGQVVHIHCNSLDIAFYDKISDLNKAKRSEKLALEKDNKVQLNLLNELQENNPLEVFRYEVRLVGKASVKRAFSSIENPTFEKLFSKHLCQNVLIKHWKSITSSVDLLSLDANKPYELLQNYIEENPNSTPQASLAAVGGLLIANQYGVARLRNTIESCFGRDAWHRNKSLFRSPQLQRFTHFQRIDEQLGEFGPTYITDYITNIENNVK